MKAKYHNIIPSQGSSFRAVLFEDKEFPAAWHFHEEYELTYIVKSTGVRYVGNSMETFDNDDLVMVGANLPHCWKTIGEQTEDVKCIVIQWQEDLLKNWLDKKEIKFIKDLLKRAQRGIRFDKELACEIKPMLLKMVELPPFERLILFMQVLQKLALSSQFELLAGPNFTNSLSYKESERINVVYDYLKENYLNKITVDDISEVMNMSSDTFSRFFKKTFHSSFFTFLNEYKISIACKMLIDTDLSISEIGYKVGYNNLTFFHRQFQKHMQVSPSKYRKSYQRIPIVGE
ncbi:AraC-like DNA-binding protein/mannose-6-phosphate isomerase-like protein (cupin superfamily) [Wenyingzhuangia heitensis]|uniref:AraC-like DNA-binding protein/mannose-6-phosphate isomerase-like protein (Cupin superfamily) n=1 Tax=Wenyingzhuangia heitensis TaxID=1487859 RepID=A0ABX0U4G2_9FLAO|nr:AraC family transcriptional regulator [Wenyingzhuangia heitensis]NIJ43744.1 AraC-like DNA-binding protein/mannose-6-phosphate isomerase-like protein (cupin superfamily) [Wenyingzhuangia heitensis]